MKVYLASLSTNNYELENTVYKTFQHSLGYIYYNLKTLSLESIKDCDFFDRDYIQKYFTKEYFDNFKNVVCKSVYGEFCIKKVKSSCKTLKSHFAKILKQKQVVIALPA